MYDNKDRFLFYSSSSRAENELHKIKNGSSRHIIFFIFVFGIRIEKVVVVVGVVVVVVVVVVVLHIEDFISGMQNGKVSNRSMRF